MKIHIIAAALPPQRDGIGDYTAALAAEMKHSADVTVLTGIPAPASIGSIRVETAFSADVPASVRQIAHFVKEDRPDWVLLQYNPFSYGRWGLNLHLPEVMRGLRRVSPSTRLAVMVHEPFVPIRTPQFAVMAIWQRWQLRRLGRSADMVFFSIEFWQHAFRRWFPGKPLVHLPVGSNIPQVSIGRQEARARLGIRPEVLVLGLFGTAGSGRMLNRAGEALTALREAKVPVQLLYVGPHRAAVCTALGGADMIAEGPFPADEVSRRLCAMDIYLAAYEDGVSTRRGAFMAALQHGIATVGTQGPLTDSLLDKEEGHAFLLADVADPEQFQAQVRRLAGEPAFRAQIAQAGRSLYEHEFSWTRIADKLYRTLTSTGK